MKKSISAPCLQNIKPNAIKKNVSVHAFPDINLIQILGDEIQKEIQLESILHTTTSQLTSCMIQNKEFPSDILQAVHENILDTQKYRAISECIIEPEPDEKEQEYEMYLRRNMSYLNLTEMCEKTAEKYATYLRKIRKNRKKNV